MGEQCNAAKDARCEAALANRAELRARKRQELENHSSKVQGTLQWSKQDEALQAQHLAERLNDMFRRSEEHQENCRAEREAHREALDQKINERVHEALRVQRM